MTTEYKADGWINTYTGLAFFYAEPTVDMVCIEDIAHALSHACRFTGHCRRFYSVAEHSALLMKWSRDKSDVKRNKDELRAVLLHDAAEAFIADVARPAKALLPQYRELEARIEAVIAKKFNIPFPLPQWIKDIDVRILADERAQIMTPAKHMWLLDEIKPEPLGVTIDGLGPVAAREAFMGLYTSIMK